MCVYLYGGYKEEKAENRTDIYLTFPTWDSLGIHSLSPHSYPMK